MAKNKEFKATPLVRKKRSPLSLFMVIIAAAISGALVEQYFNKNNNTTNNTITNSSLLASYVRQKSDTLPKRIEDGTIWEAVDASKDEVLYTYRIEDTLRDSMSAEDVAVFVQIAEMPISKVVCNSGAYSPFFLRNIKVTYIYLGARGKEIARFHFTQDKCKRS